MKELIDIIRSKNIKYLSDPEKLEKELLPELGFNDEYIEEYPKDLHQYCGKGLKSWQYPNQFSKYLVHLSKCKIESYIELGVRHGGTFIITVEYLNRFHPIKKALAIDINDCPPVTEYKKYNPNADFWQLNTQTFKFNGFCNHCNGIDLVMIDADHAYEAVKRDFMNVQRMSRMIAIHDISNDACRHVNRLWREVKNDKNRYDAYEFIDQYQKEKNFFGMGLLEDKVLPIEK